MPQRSLTLHLRIAEILLGGRIWEMMTDGMGRMLIWMEKLLYTMLPGPQKKGKLHLMTFQPLPGLSAHNCPLRFIWRV